MPQARVHLPELTSPSSQFYLTFRDTPHLDKKHTVFGKLVGGEDVLDVLEKVPLKDGTERPAKSISVTEVIMYVAMKCVIEVYLIIILVIRIHSRNTKQD